MSAPAQPRPPRGEAVSEPLHLWHQLLRARAEVAEQRHVARGGPIPNARVELLSALEAYVACLASRGRPIPYALRDELRLSRLTSSSDRYQR